MTERIDDQYALLTLLQVAWLKHPQLRLGQLIENVLCAPGCCIFNVPDKDFVEKLRGYIQ